MGEHLVDVFRQKDEQFVLGWGERELASVFRRVSRGVVDMQRTVVERARFCRLARRHRGAPQIRTDAREQLIHRKGLGEVVVRPAVQPVNLVFHFGLGSQEHDRGRIFFLPENLHDLGAAADREHDVHKYVIIKGGVLCVLETDRMKEVIRNELGVFDYRDYIFDDDPSVYLLVKDLSVYDTDHTIVYRSFPDDADGYFNGTVIFTKMDDFGFASLSHNDIDIIRSHLRRLPDGLFEMSYSLKDSY